MTLFFFFFLSPDFHIPCVLILLGCHELWDIVCSLGLAEQGLSCLAGQSYLINSCFY